MFVTLATALACLPAPQSDWYVDGSVSGPGTGTLSDPYSTIQAAVDAATTVDGDQIRILAGDYAEDILIDGKRVDLIQDSSTGQVRVLKSQAGVRGITISDIPAPGLLVQGLEFVQLDPAFDGGGARISSSVVELDRCTFGSHVDNTLFEGGGIMIDSSSDVTIVASTVRDCVAAFGMGISCEGSLVEIVDSLIEGNGYRPHPPFMGSAASGTGGGISVRSGNVNIRNSEVRGNTATNGAGIFQDGGNLDVRDTQLIGNGNVDSTSQGGGYLGISSSCTFGRCRVEGNQAQYGSGATGPGIFTDCSFRSNTGAGGDAIAPAVAGAGSDLTLLIRCLVEDHHGFSSLPSAGYVSPIQGCSLEDCLVRNCTARSSEASSAVGGAMRLCVARDSTFASNGVSQLGGSGARGGAAFETYLERCVLIGNTSDIGGAAARCAMINCTLVENTASLSAGGASDSTLNSCIVFANTGGQLDAMSSAIWSAVEGGFAGTSNIAMDPLLANTVSPSLQVLTATSPCIDAGEPTRLDPDGSRVDMGALPFDSLMSGSYCAGLGVGPCEAGLGTFQPFSLSSSIWRFSADNLTPRTFGFAFVGLSAQAPAGGNTVASRLCVGGALFRTDVQVSTGQGPCDASMTLAVPTGPIVGAGVVVGQSVFLQLVHRARGPLGFGLSAGREVIIQP